MAINVFGPSQGSPSTSMGGWQPDEYEYEALQTLNAEKAMWNEEQVFVTTDLSYLIRSTILRCRKNYYGVFDQPLDEVTGERKTWIPLTEWSVEAVVKSIDLDTKDILIRPGTPQAVTLTPIIRALVMQTLKDIEFGQLLNDTLRVMARDGTAIVKVWHDWDDKLGKRVIRRRIVDLLNFWIDPSADTIQTSSAVIERSYMTKTDLMQYKDVWKNLEYAPTSLNVSRIYQDWGGWSFGRGEVPFVEMYERWGKIRKSWITKDKEDHDTWIEGMIVGSGLGGPLVIHYIGENPREDGVRPYEEVWYKRVDGRWFGRGVSEMLFGLQEYENMIINIRKMNNMVLQNGLFLIRKGSGVSPDVINSISAGGGIPVTDVDRDIKQLNVQDYRQSSYTDEDRVSLYADRVTGSFDINKGEAGKASVSATATLTQDRNIRDTFVLVQEGIGFWIERLITNQILPILKKITKPNEVIRISGDIEALDKIDETILENRKNRFVEEYANTHGFYPEPEKIDEFVMKQRDMFGAQGKQRFVDYFKNVFNEKIDVDVNITDEKFNRVVAVQQLQNMLVAFSRLPTETKLNTDAIMNEILNMMGIKGEFFLESARVPALSAAATQAGRLMKNEPMMPPSEMTAMQNAQGIPQMGQQMAPGAPQPPPQTAAIPQQVPMGPVMQ